MGVVQQANNHNAPMPSEAPNVQAKGNNPAVPPPPPLPEAIKEPAQQAPAQQNFDGLKMPLSTEQQTALEYSRRQLAPPYAADTIREDGVVVRRNARIHTIGDGTEGAYISGSDGIRYHNTGTSDKGAVVASHAVDRAGNVRMHPDAGGPKVFTSEIAEIIGQLGLKKVEGSAHTFTRRGFSGEYNIQIEKDGSFSIHYSGGHNSSGQSCSAQTYHHGRWDKGRKASLWNDADQKTKWENWQSKEVNETTAVSVAHNAEVIKSNSGFHTATSSITLNQEGKMSSAQAVTTQAEQQAIAKISNSPQTWSGSYIQAPNGAAATYSFACQHNETSGILTIKQTTLDNNEVPETVRSTYALAINSNREISVANREHFYTSLLTEQKMLASDEKTVVMLKANGDVYDYTNQTHYQLQVKEGQPLSWIAKPLEEEAKAQSRQGAPQPMAAPNLENDATPTLSAEEKTQAKTSNTTRAIELGQSLLQSGSISRLVPDEKISYTSPVSDRAEIGAAHKITDPEKGSAYVFSRSIKTAGQQQGAVLFISESELTSDVRTSIQKQVHSIYEAAKQDDGTLKTETWYQLQNNGSRRESDTFARIRSDGSVELKHVNPDAGQDAAPISPDKCGIYVPVPANKENLEQGINWRYIPGQWNTEAGRTERTIKQPQAQSQSLQTTNSSAVSEEEIKRRGEADDIARQIYSAIAPSNIINDNEEKFVQQVELAKQKGMLGAVNNSLTRLFNTNIQALIEHQGTGGWFGIGEEHMKRLNAALEGHNEPITAKYEPATSKFATGIAPSMPTYSNGLGR